LEHCYVRECYNSQTPCFIFEAPRTPKTSRCDPLAYAVAVLVLQPHQAVCQLVLNIQWSLFGATINHHADTVCSEIKIHETLEIDICEFCKNIRII